MQGTNWCVKSRVGYKCGEYEANDDSRHTYVKRFDITSI